MSRPPLLRNKKHLVRMAGIFGIGITLFLGLQMLLVPKTFGRYGHYRAAAIDEEAARPVRYAGRAACASCHTPVVEAKQAGKHAALGCEGCHGALMQHGVDPARNRPRKPDPKALCPSCHEVNVARPKWLKQVKSAEHSSGESCTTCHPPHAPQM